MFLTINGKPRQVPPAVRARLDDPHPAGGTVADQFLQDPDGVTAWALAEEERFQQAQAAAAGPAGPPPPPLAGDALRDALRLEHAQRERLHAEAQAAPIPTPTPAPGRRTAPKPAPEA